MSNNVHCEICQYELNKEYYPKHLENEHLNEFEELRFIIKQLILSNIDLKDIAKDFNLPLSYLMNEAEVNKINRNFVQENETNYKINTQPLKLGPDSFNVETTTVWSFPERGQWATHNPKYRGNWSPHIPRNILLRYSRAGDTVLDQFVGSGTTLIESKILNRNAIGVDINPVAVNLTKRNLDFQATKDTKIDVVNGDARNLNFINDSSIDLICTHPPYSDIIRYSENIDGDLSLLGIEDYFLNMQSVARECKRVLKKGKYCAILIGDTRKKGNIVPLGFQVMQTYISAGFVLKEIIIKEQHNCSSTPYWREQSLKYNFLLIAHEYLFILRS